MAYYLPYKAQFYNQIGQFVEVEFWNQTFTDTTELIPLVSFKHEYINGNQDKFDPIIIGSRCIIQVRARHDSADALNNETFYANAYDEWKVLAYVDSIPVFAGFITMDVEPYVLKDKPYNIVITASDGLGLLKNIPLTDVSEVEFDGRNSILEYICGALKKTNLDLNVRVCLNWYNAGQDDRYDVGSPDMLAQTTLHHRTFVQDANGFYDCYTALERILGKWAVLFQWKGRWVISNRAELMYTDQYYTEYDSNGTSPTVTWDLTGYQRVEKDLNIAPVNIDQLISYQTPIKTAKTIYRYEVPENLVNNQKLQRLGTFSSPLSGSGYSAYSKVGWTAKEGTLTTLTDYAGTKNSYIRTEQDSYNTETERYYRIEPDSTLTNLCGHFIQNDNDDFFVDQNDQISLEFQWRAGVYDVPISTSGHVIAQVAILVDGGNPSVSTDWYTMDSTGAWHNDITHIVVGVDEILAGIPTYFNDFISWKVTDSVIPASGVLYINLCSRNFAFITGNYVDHRPVNITYVPYLKGARFSTKGDYWLTSQNTNIKDVIEDEVFISDAPKRILKGALWNEAGTALTNPDWYKLNETENRHFKELINLGRYRQQYVRQRRVEGTFKGTMFMPSSDPTNPIPLGFHRQFYITNLDHAYVLVPPLEIDYVRGMFRGTLMSCFTSSTDLVTEGNTHTFNYIF